MRAFSTALRETNMLARRFTIVCLVVTLFGMVFAILVTDAGRPKRQYQTAEAAPCLVGPKLFCRSVNQD